jgi:hypothetical protein
MKRLFLAACLLTAPMLHAHAVTVSNGIVIFNQTDALAGNVTPGDAPGFPVTISATGAYRLSGNLAVAPNVNGIEVTAPEVTLDFFGFRMTGGGGQANRGVLGKNRALTVSNGTVRGFKLAGIESESEQLTVNDMRVSDNGVYGIVAPSTGATIRNSEAFGNSAGISCGSNCLIDGNNIVRNTIQGIDISGANSMIIGNNISLNGTGIFMAASASAGNNAIIGNSTSVTGASFIPINPNACNPAC